MIKSDIPVFDFPASTNLVGVGQFDTETGIVTIQMGEKFMTWLQGLNEEGVREMAFSAYGIAVEINADALKERVDEVAPHIEITYDRHRFEPTHDSGGFCKVCGLAGHVGKHF